MGEEILTPPQKIVIKEVAKEPLLAGFYLSGGTALAAYYLKHRLSEDLDFFAEKDFNSAFIHSFAEKLEAILKSSKMRFEHIYDRYQFFFEDQGEGLKVEFTKYAFSQLEPPTIYDGMRVDSFRDIAANKLMALLDRFEPKDFVDLFFILPKRKLKDILKDVKMKFGLEVSNIFLGGELMKVKRIAALPRMISPLTVEELKEFFIQKAKELGPEIFR